MALDSAHASQKLATGQAWGPWFLLVLFGGILVWEEVWDLPNTAYLSAWLLLLITAGAMVRPAPLPAAGRRWLFATNAHRKRASGFCSMAVKQRLPMHCDSTPQADM